MGKPWEGISETTDESPSGVTICFLLHQSEIMSEGLMAYTCNPNTREAEGEGSTSFSSAIQKRRGRAALPGTDVKDKERERGTQERKRKIIPV